MNPLSHRVIRNAASIVMGCLLGAGTAAVAEDAFLPLDIQDVRLGGELGRRIEITVTNNLLVLDAENDFLAPFRAKTRRSGYIGLGKLFDATVKFAANTGDPRVLALRERLLAGILACQEPDGYIGTFAPDHRVWSLWDVHETGYVIWGLLTDYRHYGDPRSLAAARKAADYLVRHWPSMPDGWGVGTDVARDVGVTGIERAMLALHGQTGERAYLDFCLGERALPEWELGIVVGRRPGIEGHVYAYMARCLAQLELYRLDPQARLLVQTRHALDFMVHHDGMLVTGATGQCEIWTGDQDGRGDLGETCATAYQLRVYDSLLRLTGEARYGDLMERTIHNTLFAAQSPDGRKLRYFAPLEGKRVYWEGDTYCCPCNYRRIIAELPLFAFYRAGDGVAVNLYTSATARCAVAGGAALTLRSVTSYPSSGGVALSLELSEPARFPLRLRIPAWVNKARVAVNGAPVERRPEPGSFLTLERDWTSGDRVTLDLPMPWRLVKGRQRQAGRAAVMRGPQVFCLDPSRLTELAEWDGAELGYLTLDPGSFEAPHRSTAVRPDGIAVRLRAWKPGFSLAREGDIELTLTEFPDPHGRATYFRLRDPNTAVDDELLAVFP